MRPSNHTLALGTGSEQALLLLKCTCDKHVVCESEVNIHTFLHPSEVFGVCAKIP